MFAEEKVSQGHKITWVFQIDVMEVDYPERDSGGFLKSLLSEP